MNPEIRIQNIEDSSEFKDLEITIGGPGEPEKLEGKEFVESIDIEDLEMGLFLEIEHKKVLEASGLDPEKMVVVWRGSASIEMETLFARNVAAIEELEKEVPGGPKILLEQFGIYNFARYPKEVLVKQITERDNKEKPYGAVITAYYDHNNAFLDSDWHNVLTKLNKALGKDFAMRITESGNILNFARTVSKFQKRYGANRKLDYAILSGHGNDTQFDFGRHDNLTNFVDSGLIDLRNPKVVKRFKKYENCFNEHASLILDSCSGGAVDEDGNINDKAIGNVLSEALHKRVYAAVGQGSLSDINVKVFADRVSFFPHYHNTGTHEISP